MRKMMAVVVLLALVAAPVVCMGDVSASSVISAKDAQADFAAAKYTECLQKIASLVNAPKNTPADRAALLALKAECLMAQKMGPMASDAFLTASTAYTTAKDAKNAATEKATGALIKFSTEFMYTPKTGDKTPLPIIDQAARPLALTAFFNDQLAVAQEGYKALQGKTSLPDIEAFAPKLQDLDVLEMAATGNDTKTTTMQKALATQAKSGMDQFITSGNSKADAIAASAAKMVPVPGSGGNGGGKGGKGGKATQQQMQEKGLTDQEKTTLNDLLANADKIQPATKSLVTALMTDADYFKTEIANAAALRKHIEAILGGKFK